MLFETHTDEPEKVRREPGVHRSFAPNFRSNLEKILFLPFEKKGRHTQFSIRQSSILFLEFHQYSPIAPTEAHKNHSTEEGDQNDHYAIVISNGIEILNSQAELIVRKENVSLSVSPLFIIYG